MTDIDLLPLPEGESSSFGDYEVHDNEAMIEYARANVARNTALLRVEIEVLRAEVDGLREALEDIRSRSAMKLAMNPNPFALTARLGDIHQIADAAQDRETIAYVTRNEEGDPAMLFFDLNEAKLYCEPGEEPEALVLARAALHTQERKDAERWRALREMDGGEIYALLGDCDGIHPELTDAAIDAAMRKEDSND